MLLLLHASGPDAAAQAIRCGATVRGAVRMPGDLACRTGHGLVLASGAALDCAGHRISGGGQSGQYGVYVQAGRGSAVSNCVVERFDVGIRLKGAVNARIVGNTSRDNLRYGIEITQESSHAVVKHNQVLDNGDEGLHVSGPAGRDASHRIVRNTFDGNEVEGIYLLRSNANFVAHNRIQHHGSAGIYVKGSARNAISGNSLIEDPIQLVAGSSFNVLSDNTIVGQAIKFSDASYNEVYNHSVEASGGRPSVAYDFTGASGNVVVDSEAVGPSDYDVRAKAGSINNVFTRFAALGPLSCSVDNTSSISMTNERGSAVRCGR
jgi:parallel beta-helix repeat protein